MTALSLMVPLLTLKMRPCLDEIIWPPLWLCHKSPVMNWPCLKLQTHSVSLPLVFSNPALLNFLWLPEYELLSQLCAFTCGWITMHKTPLITWVLFIFQGEISLPCSLKLLSIPLVSTNISDRLSLHIIHGPALSQHIYLLSVYLLTCLPKT